MRSWSCITMIWIISVFLLLVPGLYAQDCQVSFTINPPLSNFTLGGAVTKPLTSPLTSANPEILSGLQGDLVASLPGPCPTDAAGLETALATAQLTTTPSTGLVDLYPSQITLKAGDLATLVLTDVAFDSTLQLAAESNQATLSMTVAEGSTNSTSIVSPAGDTIDLVGVTASNTTEASITTEGSKVSITLPDVVLTLASEYITNFAGQPLEGGANYVLTGSVVMETVVGCPESCGPNGRCAEAEDGTVGCQCECGWSSNGCTVPSGFCPRYADDDSAAAICPVNPPLPPSVPDTSGGGDGGQIAACGAALCSTWQFWDATTGSCQCKEGFEGPGCDACQDDAACSAYFSTTIGQDVSATCSTSRLYSTETVYKAYKCDADNGLEGVEPGTFSVGCNTTTGTWSGGATPGSTPSVAEGSYCEVQFAMAGKANNPITCKTSLCAFQSNSSRVSCQSTSCSCRTACPDLHGVFSKIQNQPAVIDCDEAGVCTFDIKDFFVTLKVPCTNHECLVEGYVMQEDAYTDDPSDKNWTPLIAAIPLLALVAAACVFSFYLLANRAFFKGAQHSKALANGADSAAVGKAASSPQIVDSVREIAFSDISKLVPMRGGERRAILSHVSGVARIGELVGVLGPSGGGKTSLLSVLAGSIEDSGSNAIITGSVTLDGRPLDTSLARRVAYCAQDCTLLSTLSVEECVRYSALLRLPADTSSSEVATVIKNVIDELGLTKVAGSLVGGASGIRGVSGGERRRITIAMELVTNPAILILDEPTSGLDSFTAYQMMSTLKSVANSGRIVMLSFHQPSPAMFTMIDRCFLMAQGRCVFTGAPNAVEAHFAGIGLPVSSGVGAAEHMLHCACDPASLPILLSSIEGINQKDADDGVKYLTTSVGESSTTSEDAEAGVLINATSSPATTVTASSPSSSSLSNPAAGAGVSRQLAVLFWRASMDILRNPTLLLLHWVMGLLMGLFSGCVFFSVGLDIAGAQDRLGAIFFSLAFFAFTSLTTVDLIMNERRIVSREVRGGYYNPATYYATKAVLDALLLRAIPVLLYSASFYPMTGFLGGANHVGLFLMVVATFAVAIGALSLAVAVGSGTPGQASLTMNIILLISLLVGGFFVNAASMPVWISWLRFVSPFFYAYSALTVNEFSSLLLNFEVEGYTAVQNVRGTTFLDVAGINYNRLTEYVVVLDCMYAIFLLLGFALLYWRMPRARTLENKKVAAAAERK